MTKMLEAYQRAQVVAEAKSWVKTPYHHAQGVKGAGVDCGMLLIKVFANVGLIDDFDPRPYTHDWFLHQDAEIYLDHLKARAVEVDEVKAGDIMVWRHGRTFSHAAIVTDWPLIVHAYTQFMMVIEEPITQNLQLQFLKDGKTRRPVKFFSYWGPR